jgi:uncharacterized protein
MPTTLLAGGSGLIGKRLSEMLHAQGHSVRLLTRTPRGEGQFAWNPAAGTLDEAALEGVDFVVNLAGAGIADRRWTAARKRELVQSRVQSAEVLRRAFEREAKRPRAYVSASAIGFYGNSGEDLMLETSAPADQSFMVECCQKWEQAADAVAALGIRTVKLRIGVVLATEGGALAEFVKPLRFGLGTYFADGQAWYSWIHRDDVCRAFVWALENESVEGIFNAVAPQPVRNRDLVQATARAMRQPVLMLPAPAFALRLMLGEMSAVVLNSNRVSAEKIERAGFQFDFPTLEGALGEIFDR